MARFCGKCGNQVSDTQAFCDACGAPLTHVAPVESAPSSAYQPVPEPTRYAAVPPVRPTPTGSAAYVPMAAAPVPVTPVRRGSGLRILLVVLVVLGLGALGVIGSMLYLGHKVVTKIESKAAEVGLTPSDADKSGPVFTGDPCRFLSKAEVSKAIGVTIVDTRSGAGACEYLAHGTAASMTSKHLSAIAGQRGADKAAQDRLQKFAQDIFETQQKNAEAADPKGPNETTVVTISFDESSARSQMRLNSKVLGAFGQTSDSQDLKGIGDEAFVAAGGMMFVRKGDTLIRITYIGCPCSTKQILPLAKKVADAV